MRQPLRYWLLGGALLLAGTAQAQTGSVGIGTASPNTSALLDLSSTSKGLLIPRLTSAQRTAVSTPATGLLVYQTDGSAGLYQYDGTAWKLVAADNLGNHTATQNLNLADKLLVGNGGTTGLSITSGGNVGVGTTSPQARLELVAGANADGSGDPRAMAFQWSGSGNGYRHWLRTRHQSVTAQSGNAFDFFLNNGTTSTSSAAPGVGSVLAMSVGQVNGSPRVGIGVTDATTALDVNGQVKISGGSPGAGKVLTSDAAGLATWQTPASGLTLPYSGSASSSSSAFSVGNTGSGAGLTVSSGVVVFASSASNPLPTTATTLTPTATMVAYTDNASTTNGIVTLGTGTAGQLLILTNLDNEALTVVSVTGVSHTILKGYGVQFVYLGGAWYRIS